MWWNGRHRGLKNRKSWCSRPCFRLHSISPILLKAKCLRTYKVTFTHSERPRDGVDGCSTVCSTGICTPWIFRPRLCAVVEPPAKPRRRRGPYRAATPRASPKPGWLPGPPFAVVSPGGWTRHNRVAFVVRLTQSGGTTSNT